HPELARFVTTAVPAPLISGARRITNDPLSPAAGEAVPFPTLHAIAAGVPRSFPFHDIAIHFHSPEFGELIPRARAHGKGCAEFWWVIAGWSTGATARCPPGRWWRPTPPI